MPPGERAGITQKPPAGERSSRPAPREGSAPRPLRAFGTLEHADILQLQRSVGNRAAMRAMATRPTPGRSRAKFNRQSQPVSAPGLPLQRLLERGSNTGWGLFGWVDDKAEQLWKDLDRKFNHELPSVISELKALSLANPSAQKVIEGVIAEMENTQQAHDGVIQHKDADKLNALLDSVIKTANDTKASVASERRAAIAALVARLGTPLTNMAINFQDTGLDAKRRKNLLATLNGLKSGDIFDPGTLGREVSTLEADYSAARAATLKSVQERENEKKRLEALAQQSEAEQKRQAAVLDKIRKKLPAYQSALAKCDADVDKLAQLVEFIALGEGGKLDACLLNASADNLLALFNIHRTSITNMNKLLSALGKGKEETLKTLLGKVSLSDDEKLLEVIQDTTADEQGLLTPLLGKLDLPMLGKLLKQTSAAALTGLFITQKLDVGETRLLLASDCAANTAFLLGKVPDPKLVNAIRALTGSPAELKVLISDLPNDGGAVAGVKALFARKDKVTTLADIKGLTTVKQARGVLTNAGATIPEETVSDLAGEEQKAVQAGLDAIDAGKPQALTHPNAAKFGDTFDNNAGRLPGLAGGGGYKEYYVEKDPASPSYHGDRRLVVSDKTGHTYYTDDHYGTFHRIR